MRRSASDSARSASRSTVRRYVDVAALLLVELLDGAQRRAIVGVGREHGLELARGGRDVAEALGEQLGALAPRARRDVRIGRARAPSPRATRASSAQRSVRRASFSTASRASRCSGSSARTRS